MRKSTKIKKVNDPYGVARIKTQHSALGLLMAECEQLRRDLAQAKAENARLAAEIQTAIEALWFIQRNTVHGDQDNGRCDCTICNELARLRDVLTSSAKSDTNTP